MHGSFVLGIALGEYQRPRPFWRRMARCRWQGRSARGVFLVAALLVSMVNPHGPYSLLFVYDLSRMTSSVKVRNGCRPLSRVCSRSNSGCLVGAVALMIEDFAFRRCAWSC